MTPPPIACKVSSLLKPFSTRGSINLERESKFLTLSFEGVKITLSLSIRRGVIKSLKISSQITKSFFFKFNDSENLEK